MGVMGANLWFDEIRGAGTFSLRKVYEYNFARSIWPLS